VYLFFITLPSLPYTVDLVVFISPFKFYVIIVLAYLFTPQVYTDFLMHSSYSNSSISSGYTPIDLECFASFYALHNVSIVKRFSIFNSLSIFKTGLHYNIIIFINKSYRFLLKKARVLVFCTYPSCPFCCSIVGKKIVILICFRLRLTFFYWPRVEARSCK
jgi:hypothetical protein